MKHLSKIGEKSNLIGIRTRIESSFSKNVRNLHDASLNKVELVKVLKKLVFESWSVTLSSQRSFFVSKGSLFVMGRKLMRKLTDGQDLNQMRYDNECS